MVLITPRLEKRLLAAQAEALQKLQITLIGGQLQVVEQFPAASDHLQKAAARGVVFGMNRKVLRQFIDTCRQDCDLHIGTAGVFFVQFEFLGACGSFAHGQL